MMERDRSQPPEGGKKEFFWGCLPFVSTPLDVVTRMLELARVGPSDSVMDLGCGDGRILMEALEHFGANRAIGYEIREDLVKEALATFEAKGLMERVKLVKGDLLGADLKEATVITIYLTGTCNELLRSKFEEEAAPGTRIVSHGYGVDGWRPSVVDGTTGHRIFLYDVPRSYSPNSIPLRLRFWH